MKGIQARLAEALQDTDLRDYLLGDYHKELLDRAQKWEDKYQRTVFLGVIASATFVLLATGTAGSLSLFGVQIDDPALPLKALAPLLAYLFSDAVGYRVGAQVVTQAHTELERQRGRLLYDNDLERYVMPASPLWAYDIFRNTSSGTINTILGWVFTVTFGAALVLPSVFLLYALGYLLVTFGAGDLLVWLSLAVSMVYVVQGAALIFAWNQLDRAPS